MLIAPLSTNINRLVTPSTSTTNRVISIIERQVMSRSLNDEGPTAGRSRIFWILFPLSDHGGSSSSRY
jgi:hypothetical protein